MCYALSIIFHHSLLRYLDGCGVNHLSPTMIHRKLSQLLEADTIDWREVTKYSKALTTAAQHQMPHGESVALLDLHPWGNCNEASLVQNYVDSVPLRKRPKKRRECPVAASVLFRTNGPHVTGEANMKTIAAYEKDKADKAAAKDAKKLARTKKSAKRRQDATMDVVKMVIQELLLTQTPPLQYYDESHNAVSRTFKPDTNSCKKFMQVSGL